MRTAPRFLRTLCLKMSAGALLSLAAALAAPSATQTAVANGDTRTLHLFHTHTGESIDATFRVDGHYDQTVLRQLNHFLRDWRNNDEINMDPRLFDTLWEVYRTAGATDPIQIYSAYRSPETNAMLRRRSRAVAEHSQHMLGKAMDTTIPGFPMHRIREIGMRLQRGGVGWYPAANFVHLDVGGVRSWPRMSYDQLAGLFPDGKTVHIASNGQVLPGYEAARAEIAARGGTDLPPAQESGGFFAWLFGSGSSTSAASEDEEDRRATAVAAAPARRAAPVPAPAPQVQPQPQVPDTAVAYAEPPAQQATDEDVPPARKAAAAETTAAPEPVAARLPLPPRRPVEFAAALTPAVPLPPLRPDVIARAQRLAVASLPAAGSGLRKASLPALITGGDAHLPAHALSFADAGALPAPAALRGAPMPVARPGALRSVGLRAAAQAPHHPAAPAVAAAHEPAAARIATGPQLTGLRKAARALTDHASL